MPNRRIVHCLLIATLASSCALRDERDSWGDPPSAESAAEPEPEAEPTLVLASTLRLAPSPTCPEDSVPDGPDACARIAPAGDAPISCAGHTATSLPDGRILLVGECSYYCFPPSALLFNPQLAIWEWSPELLVPRHAHTTTLLSDGSVLVIGGQSRDGTILDSMERWAPGTAEWQSAGSLLHARRGHIATLLPDGRLLVSGGATRSSADGGDACSHSAEIVDPWSGRVVEATPPAAVSCDRSAPTPTRTPIGDGRTLVVGETGAELWERIPR